jgi:hypothetical protein
MANYSGLAQRRLEDPRPRDEVVVGQEARAHAVAASMTQAGRERAMSEEVDDGGAEGHEVVGIVHEQPGAAVLDLVPYCLLGGRTDQPGGATWPLTGKRVEPIY